MMLKLFKENIRIVPRFHPNTIVENRSYCADYCYWYHRLVSILTVSANTISSDFASMGANTFNLKQYENTTRNRGKRTTDHKSYHFVSWSSRFQNKYGYPFTQTSLSFTATSAAEIKYEATKTDPENAIVGVDEFYDQLWFRNKFWAKFYWIWYRKQYVCVVGSDFEKDCLKM
jgi:putative ABC transport system permease protein